jgi:hypothetical protein
MYERLDWRKSAKQRFCKLKTYQLPDPMWNCQTALQCKKEEIARFIFRLKNITAINKRGYAVNIHVRVEQACFRIILRTVAAVSIECMKQCLMFILNLK